MGDKRYSSFPLPSSSSSVSTHSPGDSGIDIGERRMAESTAEVRRPMTLYVFPSMARPEVGNLDTLAEHVRDAWS